MREIAASQGWGPRFPLGRSATTSRQQTISLWTPSGWNVSGQMPEREAVLEGSIISVGGHTYKISYIGGNGNDVTVRRIHEGGRGRDHCAPCRRHQPT